MKNSVENDPMKLGFKRNTQLNGIILYTFSTDIDLGSDARIRRKIKCDDICIKVMFKELPVYFQDSLIRAKDKIDGARHFTLLSKNRKNEFLKGRPMGKTGPYILEKEANF